MTQPPTASHSNSKPGDLLYAGMAAALPWATVMVFRYLYLMIPQPPGSERHSPGLWMVYKALGKPFEFGDASFPFWQIIGGLVALYLFTLIGRLFLACFELYLPKNGRRFLALLCGFSIVGISMEILAIFHVLYWPAVWGVLLAIVIALWRVSFLSQRKTHPSSVDMKDARVLRRALEREAESRYERTLIRPQGKMERLFQFLTIVLISLITFLTFYHALLVPEAYWDSLILYLGYARMTFLEHGFPVKVVAQVGIGLGANYPHLFSVLGSTVATMFGHWSPVYQQLMAPVAGLATTILIYHTALRMTRRVNHALAAALLFRAVPYGIAYNIYASDYAIVMLLAAGFLYVALLYVETGLPGLLAVLTLLTATGSHVNYLMNAMWGVWAVVVLAAHFPRKLGGIYDAEIPRSEEGFSVAAEPSFARQEPRLALRNVFRWRFFWVVTTAGIALTLPWHLRNFIVTGNPVYAFFADLFPTKNYNAEVMASAFMEWRANGDGIGVVAEQMYGVNTLLHRLRATWFYFFLWEHPWKFAPIFAAFGIPGFLFWLYRFVKQAFKRDVDDLARFGLVAAALFGGMFLYFYFLADFYLYQIIAVLPAMAAFIGFWPIGISLPPVRFAWYGLVLATAVMPGLAIALEGPKLPFFQREDRVVANELWALRNPLIDSDSFYRLKLPGEFQAIEYVNQNLQGEKLLTHDNRHLLYDPSITLVHLDDWDVQKLYEVGSADERADRLRKLGIEYYLHIPMEMRHPVNQRLGMAGLLEAGRLDVVYQSVTNAGEPVTLFRITDQ